MKGRKTRMPALKAGISLILITGLTVWSSCTLEDELRGPARIAATFGLKTSSAMEGKVTIHEAYLKLHRLEITGTLNGSRITQLAHQVAPEDPPYRLTASDSSDVDFRVTSTVYDQLALQLFPFKDDYQLVYLDAAPVPAPDNASDDKEQGQDGEGEDSPPKDDGGEAPEDNGSDAGGNDSGDKDDKPSEKDDGDKGQDKDDKGQGKDDKGQDKKDDKKGGDKKDDDKKGGDMKDSDKKGSHKKDDKHKDGKHGNDKKGDDNKDKKKKKNQKKDKHRDDHRDDDDDDDDRDDDDDNDRKSGGQVVDLDHFFQHAKPGLVVFGTYEHNTQTISLIFVVTNVEEFSVQARQDDNLSIRLDENNPARVTFDPARWFESLTEKDIASGVVQTYEQQTVLFIHPDHNTALYNTLVSRLEGATDFEIQTPDPASNL